MAGYSGAQPPTTSAASEITRISGKDHRDQDSSYVRSSDGGVVGLLAYDVCSPLTEEEYDKWLFDVHYHDLMSNPHLDKIVLHTVSKDKKARLSSGADVENKVDFFRLAQLHFQSFEAYDKYIAWFQANAIPPPRTPAGKSAFKFYHLSQGESILREDALASAVPMPAPVVPLSTKGARTTLIVGASGNIGAQVVRQLKEKDASMKIIEGGRHAGDGGVKLNIYDTASVKALDAALPDGVDHIVVCCGASIFGPIKSFTAENWEQSCGNKLVSISRFIIMLANGEEVKCLRPGGSITVTTGQASRTVNKMWPGIAINNAGLEAFIKCSGVDPPRGVRINSVSPALVYETAVKAGLPLAGTVPAAEVGAAYIPIIFGDMTGQVVDAGSQTVFEKSHHDGQQDGVKKA